MLSVGGVRGWSEAGVIDTDFIALAEEVLASSPDGDSRLRACVTARLSGELYFDPSAHGRRTALADEALAMARRLDDAETTAYVLSCVHWGMWVPGNVHARRAVAEEIVRLGRAASNRELEFGGLAWRYVDCLESGDIAGADEALAAEQVIAEELGRAEYDWYVGVHRTARLMMVGRFDEAAQVAEQALVDGQSAHNETSFQMYGIAQIELANARGGLEALEPVLVGLVEQYPLLPGVAQRALAYLYSLLGRDDALREHLDFLVADDFARLPIDANWAPAMAVLVIACVLARDRDRLARLYELLLPIRETFVLAGMPALNMGSCENVLALAAAELGRDDLAEAHLALGIERNVATDCLTWNVYAKFHFASALLRREEGFDRDRVAALLHDCVVDGGAMGMTRIVDDAAELAATHAIDLGSAF